MDNHSIFILGRILACNIRCMAMQAANQHRMMTDNSISYDEDAFNAEADQVETLVRELN